MRGFGSPLRTLRSCISELRQWISIIFGFSESSGFKKLKKRSFVEKLSISFLASIFEKACPLLEPITFIMVSTLSKLTFKNRLCIFQISNISLAFSPLKKENFRKPCQNTSKVFVDRKHFPPTVFSSLSGHYNSQAFNSTVSLVRVVKMLHVRVLLEFERFSTRVRK